MSKIISTKDNLQILHEDNHIIVVNKRVGDIVQGDKTGDKPLSEVVKEYLKEKYNLEFPEDDSETLSGYIIQKHESIPTQKETIIIDDYRFDILSVSETRIDTVKMKILR